MAIPAMKPPAVAALSTRRVRSNCMSASSLSLLGRFASTRCRRLLLLASQAGEDNGRFVRRGRLLGRLSQVDAGRAIVAVIVVRYLAELRDRGVIGAPLDARQATVGSAFDAEEASVELLSLLRKILREGAFDLRRPHLIERLCLNL